MDTDVIYLKFSQQSQLINSKYLVFESELVNPQQNWDNLFYNLSVQYSDTEIYATKARMGAQLIEVEVDSTLLNAENILIKLWGQKGSSFKIYTHSYSNIRKIKLFQNIDEIIEAQTVKTYQLDYYQFPDLHKNKDLFVKINIQSGIVDFYINIAEIPEKISDSQWFVNTNEVSEIIIHKQDIQSANYIYIMIYSIVSATYTLKLNIEGEIQYIDSGEIVMGILYPNTILQGFQFYKNEQNLFSSIMIEKIGDFDLVVLDCKLYVTCNIEEQYWNQDNDNQTAEYTYLLIKDQIGTIHIQNQYLSFGIIATKPHQVDFQLKIVGKDPIVYLKENIEFHHSSTTSSRTIYQYQIQTQTEFSIDKIHIHLNKHYGLIKFNGEYYNDYITMNNVVSGQTIQFDVACLHACDYSVNLQITRNYQDSIGSQAIQLDNEKILKLKIDDELFFELPNFKKGYFTLLIVCQDQLMIQQISNQNTTLTDKVLNISSNFDQPILLSQNCYYLRIYTQIPQIIQIALINHQIYRIQMNGEVFNQIDKFDKIVYTYQLRMSSNATILLKSLNNQIALNIQVIYLNQILYEEEGVQSIIHIPTQSDCTIKLHLSSNHSTAFYLKVQENSEFYYYSSNSLKLFVEQDHVKIINLSRLQNLLTYSVMFDKPVPFKIYFNYRDAGVNEFPNQTHYDHMSYHSDSIFQYENNYILQGTRNQQLILIQFGHVVNQVLTFQISKVMKVQPNNEIYVSVRKREIVYFEIDTYTNVPQIIFMFGYHQKALFLLEKGCNKTIQKQDFNYGYDLLRETNIEFGNITNGCYIGGIYNPNDNLINVSFQWLQQLYIIHDYINNTVMTKQASELTTFFYIDHFDDGKMTFYPYEGYLKIIQVPISLTNKLPQEISLLENNDLDLDYQICNISCTIGQTINKQFNKLGILIKVIFQQTKTYTIFMEDQVYNKYIQFEGTVLFQKSLNEDTPDQFKLIQQQSKLILYIRTITGQLQLTLSYENKYSYELFQIKKEMHQLDLEDKNCTIQLTQIGNQTTIYEIQTQQENIQLKFGQLYFGNNQKITFTLPLVDYDQNVTYSVSLQNQQLCDCQIQVKIWNRLTQIYSYSTNQSSVIESLPLDLNQHQMEVDFYCDPPQYEGYYVYIQPAYTHLSMVMINKEIQFNTESMSNDVYFVNIEQLGFVVIEVTQLKGQIIAYATRNVNMIYNGISELSVQTIDNFHYKLILEVDSWGILYFGIKCISQIKCEYLINVKQIKGLEFNLNDIKLGKVEYNYQSKILTLNSSIQVSNRLKTERFGIYYDNIKKQADKYISGEDCSIILNDFRGQQLFVEMEFTILDSDYSSKLMYDPITIVQQHTVIVKSQSYISYILLAILLILGLGLFLYIVQLKKKLKYEMSDARNLVNRNHEIELNSK